MLHVYALIPVLFSSRKRSSPSRLLDDSLVIGELQDRGGHSQGARRPGAQRPSGSSRALRARRRPTVEGAGPSGSTPASTSAGRCRSSTVPLIASTSPRHWSNAAACCAGGPENRAVCSPSALWEASETSTPAASPALASAVATSVNRVGSVPANAVLCSDSARCALAFSR